LFTYLSFKDVPFGEIIESLSSASGATIIWKCTLALYFLLWVLGTKNDSEDQEIVYRQVPGRGRLSYASIGVIAGIFVLAAILLWSPSFEFFVFALSLFLIFNVFSWQYLIRSIVAPSIRASRQSSEDVGDYIGREQLRVVERYLCGRWQWYRFLLGGVVVSSFWALIYLKHSSLVIPGVPSFVSWELLQALAMIVFVMAMEPWIWSERLRTKISLALLEDFRGRYLLSPAETSSPRAAR
jgi:hypothetical protein